MLLRVLAATSAALFTLTGLAVAQSAPPPFATRKIDGTDNVYIFRYQGHQSMFIVTPKGRDRDRPDRPVSPASGDDLP